jgi:cysteine-rich repeat protein
MRTWIILALPPLLAACPEAPHDSWLEPGCGNGVVEGSELCDEGADNSDTAPDACRSDCLPARCGDGVTDSQEACDDGDDHGGDGCTPLCEPELGALEVEPNDSPDQAQTLDDDRVNGSLSEGDVDCFEVPLEVCAALAAQLVGACPAPATLTLYDPSGDALAVGSPGPDGCAVLDPEHAPGARFTEGGDWALCVQGLLGGPVPFYTLQLEPVPPEDASYPLSDEDDPDGDGRPDSCDDDRDGDGVLDEEDNCPDTPNGPDMAPLGPDAEGWIRAWLAIAPFTGRSSADTCQPSLDPLLAEDDASVTPAIGDTDLSGELVWSVLWGDDSRVDLEVFASVDAPREAYHAVYLYSETARTLTMTQGPDDGAFAWFNGALVFETRVCQGTVQDHYSVEVDFEAGWNTLLVKVYDQGGGWGNYVRFLDGDQPVTDLELSLSPEGAWRPDQEDSDGDGVGDACDDTPLGV